MRNKELFLFLKYAAVAGNILFMLWITYNALKEGFNGTFWEKLSCISLMGLLMVNSILVLGKQTAK
ncbi:MAG TPA: hypothetical protein VET23_14845, partial [Chitinophagaceae bacterium]|nr:hypothetical protein [Chitinophagaceae bacterium]